MLTRRARPAVGAAVTAVLALMCVPAPAHADGVLDPVDCVDSPGDPSCRVGVDRPGRPPRGGGDREDGRDVDTGGGTDGGVLQDDGCELVLVSTEPPPEVTGPGGWYSTVCTNGQVSSQTPPQWVPAGGAVGVDPAVLARQAVSMLRLPHPGLRLNPAPPTPQVVTVPTWLWLDADAWGPRSATASVPGLSVTATATPTTVRWVTGDGKKVTCAGPGTAWTKGMDPAAVSPTCGHTYRRASSTAAGGVFAVRVTVTWQVRWVGGGQSGVAGPLTTTAATTTAVREAPAVNTGVRQ